MTNSDPDELRRLFEAALSAPSSDRAALLEHESVSVSVKVDGARSTLGKMLTKAGRFSEAEKELLEAQRALAAAQGVSARVIGENRKALVELYEEWEKAEPGKGHGQRALDWR